MSPEPATAARVGTFARLLLLLTLLLAGCRAAATSPEGLLARVSPPAGWERVRVEAFDRENLFDLVDGQAESFFVYGFERVGVARYEDAAGAILEASIWQLASPADAYGLFSVSRVGEPAPVGVDGDTDPGRRIAFWQDRYVVQMWARQPLPQADLLALARAISGELPQGGERPPLLQRLPPDLQKREPIFFHQELSIESELWLGGENVLALSPETNGVLVRLPVDGVVAHLLLLEYPSAEAATAAQGRLQAGEVDGLAAVLGQGGLLAAVFGPVEEGYASRVLAETLGSE
mgnify:CR=1 FL=1